MKYHLELIERCIKELKKHNQEYQHHTPEGFIVELEIYFKKQKKIEDDYIGWDED